MIDISTPDARDDLCAAVKAHVEGKFSNAGPFYEGAVLTLDTEDSKGKSYVATTLAITLIARVGVALNDISDIGGLIGFLDQTISADQGRTIRWRNLPEINETDKGSILRLRYFAVPTEGKS